MTKREYQRLADSYYYELERIKDINEKLIEENKTLNGYVNGQKQEIEYLKTTYNKKLDIVEVKNKILIEALGSEDTTLFNYNGDVYGIEKINHIKSMDSVETLNVEMVKKELNIVGRKGGLINSLNQAVASVTSQFNDLLYGTKKD